MSKDLTQPSPKVERVKKEKKLRKTLSRFQRMHCVERNGVKDCFFWAVDYRNGFQYSVQLRAHQTYTTSVWILKNRKKVVEGEMISIEIDEDGCVTNNTPFQFVSSALLKKVDRNLTFEQAIKCYGYDMPEWLGGSKRNKKSSSSSQRKETV